ncbi:restriction endonuclease subunit S [Moritella viscosa]|uniref:Type I restriction-modification system specificity subunit n=1 Tax=Moritella viscosa TaxID=80854 RepID=A0A1L0C8Z5_9GAMM|nr:restriction endonuclease subunit S [Moritella viscosa]SGZ17005.1 Type I restriction-modification system specificity subunit [Moritella viscosa]
MSEFLNLKNYPNDWITSEGHLFLTLGSGVSPSNISFTSNGNTPYMKVDDFNHPENASFIKKTKLRFNKEEHRTPLAKANSVIIAKRGAAIFKNRVRINPFIMAVDTNLMTISVDEQHSPFYFKYLLEFINLASIADTTSIPQLNNFHLNEALFSLPSLPEQQKIAAILTSVDDVIGQTQAQIDKLKDLKTGMMQELLTRGVGLDGKPHTEFKDSPVGRIPKGWDVALIGELFQVRLGKMLSQASKIGSNPYPYLGNKNVQWGDVDLTNLEAMDFKDTERKKFSLLKGDLLMCEGGDVGRTAIWQGEMSNCYYQKAIHRLRPIESSYEPFLLMEYMKYAKETGLLVDYISQTSIAHLTKEKLISIPLPVPSIPEQKKIVCILKSITGKINLAAQTLHKNKQLKKALMQDLLTGKVRFKVDS